ncbi:MAG: FeoA family protein [Nostocaceae cyanobacterium]|nr:FeoA family protein [Nostocaceae cyanobacterium]
MKTTNLWLLQRHQRATIADLQSEAGLQQRLQALGFRTGRQVVMLRKAWFRGLVHVRVGMTKKRDASR